MKMNREELADCLIYQIGALKGFLDAEGMTLNHIKPHGALYGMAARLDHVAHAVCDAADVFGVPILGMSGTLHEQVYPARGRRFISEYYADLDYADDGSLIITRQHAAKDATEAARRCTEAVMHGTTTSTNGRTLRVRADSICVHSDTHNAVELARAVHEAIEQVVKG